MSAQHPIIKYRLTRDGRIPEYLCTDPRAFAGMYGVDTNKPGFIPRWLSPQETQYLGMGCGEIDPEQGAPSGVSVVETKAELQTYITGISTTWTVDTQVLVGIKTETITSAGITTSPEVTFDPGPGVVVGVNTSYSDSVEKIDIDGNVAITTTRTWRTTDTLQNPFDPVAATNELWNIYEVVNGIVTG